jgi:signal transduction histidine kinase
LRSLYLRILVASIGTVLASLGGFITIFFVASVPAQGRLVQRFQAAQIEEAVRVYEREGSAAVSTYLGQLNRLIGATHYLVDAGGRDVVTGENRSALLDAPRGRFGAPPQIGGNMVFGGASGDGRYRLVVIAPPPFGLATFAPYFVLILAAVVLLCWLLALGIVSPLRELAGAVDRFGHGELTTRVPVTRRDEIGQLAASFNVMAERTEMLLTAERRLLQDISHELRSPLARLNIAIELARGAPDRELATGRLQKEVDRLTQLVGALLEVTRAEGDPSARRTETVLLQDVVHDVVQSCSLEADVRKCRVVVSEGTTRPLQGDPELLRRAVENVLRNAIRHAPEESEIELRTEERVGAAVVSIRDMGRGVPDELLPKLAQPFFRVDDARDAATGGVGLGLAIASRAIQLHHGTLTAENAHPGLRVTLTMPYQSAKWKVEKWKVEGK